MKCLMMIKTAHLAYDDRLRKECLSLAKNGVQMEIVAVEQENEVAAQTVYGGISAISIALRSRSLFPSGRKLWLKTGELYIRLLYHILRTRPSILWFHDMTFAFMIPLLGLLQNLGLLQGLVWDQHELPPDSFLTHTWKRRILAWLMNRCQVVVVASEDRKALLEEKLGDYLRIPIIPLENYPDSHFVHAPVRELPQTVRRWLAGKPYFLAQGGGHGRWRHLDELVAAIMAQQKAKLIVLGGYDREKVFRFRQQYGLPFDTMVRFINMVPQMDVPIYIDSALASVVFYEMRNFNWTYCAPNRFYQALARGIPVMVGQNPPMRDIVNQYQCGVVVDATSVERIRKRFKEMIQRKNFYHLNAQKMADRFVWEDQTSRIRHILSIFGFEHRDSQARNCDQ